MPPSTRSCRSGVLVPRTERDIATAIDIARDLKVPVLPRGGGTSQCGQTTGAALVIDNSKHFRSVLDAGCRGPHGHGGAGHRARPPQRRSSSRTACGTRWTSPPAPRPRWAAWRATTPAARAPSPTATWCTTCWARAPGCRDGELVDFGPLATLGPRASAIAQHVRALAQQHRSEIAERWPKVMRRVAGYNLDIFDNQSEKPYTADGSVNLAHLLIGAEGTLAYTRSLTLKLSAAAARQGAGHRQLPELPRGHGLGAAHRQARPHGGGAGGPHHDRAGPGQPGLPPHRGNRAHRQARGHPAGGVLRRRQGRAAAAAAASWSS